jgi:hypothetical protein
MNLFSFNIDISHYFIAEGTQATVTSDQMHCIFTSIQAQLIQLI